MTNPLKKYGDARKERIDDLAKLAKPRQTAAVGSSVSAGGTGGPGSVGVDDAGTVWRARSVILAMGSGYRELGVPNEKRLSGHGVSGAQPGTPDGDGYGERSTRG